MHSCMYIMYIYEFIYVYIIYICIYLHILIFPHPEIRDPGETTLYHSELVVTPEVVSSP